MVSLLCVFCHVGLKCTVIYENMTAISVSYNTGFGVSELGPKGSKDLLVLLLQCTVNDLSAQSCVVFYYLKKRNSCCKHHICMVSLLCVFSRELLG